MNSFFFSVRLNKKFASIKFYAVGGAFMEVSLIKNKNWQALLFFFAIMFYNILLVFIF